jgi:hypothetical protein
VGASLQLPKGVRGSWKSAPTWLRHFGQLAKTWQLQGKDPRHSRVKLASRFCRIAFQIVAGRQVFRHPSIPQRHYLVDKLNAFTASIEPP